MEVTKRRRGFATFDPETLRKVCAQGGKAAWKNGTAHHWTSDEARVAGRKGGRTSRGGGRKTRRDQPAADDAVRRSTEESIVTIRD